MARVTIDGITLEVPNGSSVLQACEAAGREIPRFCYHERLSIAGNCRMCLVEVERAPKPVASCGYPVMDGMVVKTDTEVVRRARRAVMEFLLINHPLDCPICDQGGQCDLQDQAYAYGSDTSRYAENKRAVKDKNFGPLVKTVMTRCIQCTRCVRFAAEVAGVPELGATSRGENMEITTYVERALSSELSGNLIDICPVGALTAKPAAFSARPWELKSTDSIDVTDAVGTNIIVQTRQAEVLRILPRVNDAVNEEWMADKGRFSYDGLKRRRLDHPWIRVGGKLQRASWQDAFVAIARRLKGVAGERIGAIAGDLCDAESMLALKDLMVALGSPNLDCRQDGSRVETGRREFYCFNSSILGIEEADALLLVGCDPRHDAPVLNARIRKRYLAGDFPVGFIGTPVRDLTYAVDVLGDRPSALAGLRSGSAGFVERLRAATRPMIVLGQQALVRDDAAAIQAACWALAHEVGGLAPDWNGYNVLQAAASRVGGLDLGFTPGPGGRSAAGMMSGGVDVLWLLAADEFHPARIGPQTFVIYQGHHGDAAASRADVILPGATFVEKPGTYVNTEGRVQRALAAVQPPGEAKEDWRILRAFSDVIGHRLPYDTTEALRERMNEVNPVFARQGLPRFGASELEGPPGDPAALGTAPFAAATGDYYLSNPICRASPTMAECSRTFSRPLAQAAE